MMTIDLAGPDGNTYMLAAILVDFIGQEKFNEIEAEFFGNDYDTVLAVMERELPGIEFINDPREG